CMYHLLLILYIKRIPNLLIPTLFPYTTLFRSQPFWHFSNHALFAIEGDWPQGQAKLAAFLRIDFLGDHADSPWLSYPPSPNKNGDRKSTRLNSSHVAISYAVFSLKKKIIRKKA